jgi:hypothetical protein
MANQVIDRLVATTIAKPIIANNLRGEKVDAITDLGLEPARKWVFGDWAGWDFEHITAAKRLEVNLSAARKIWGKSISLLKSKHRPSINRMLLIRARHHKLSIAHANAGCHHPHRFSKRAAPGVLNGEK